MIICMYIYIYTHWDVHHMNRKLWGRSYPVEPGDKPRHRGHNYEPESFPTYKEGKPHRPHPAIWVSHAKIWLTGSPKFWGIQYMELSFVIGVPPVRKSISNDGILPKIFILQRWLGVPPWLELETPKKAATLRCAPGIPRLGLPSNPSRSPNCTTLGLLARQARHQRWSLNP